MHKMKARHAPEGGHLEALACSAQQNPPQLGYCALSHGHLPQSPPPCLRLCCFRHARTVRAHTRIHLQRCHGQMQDAREGSALCSQSMQLPASATVPVMSVGQSTAGGVARAAQSCVDIMIPCLGVPAHPCGMRKHGSALRSSRSLGSALAPDQPRAFCAGFRVRAIRALRSRTALLRNPLWTEALLSCPAACHSAHLRTGTMPRGACPAWSQTATT